MRSLVLIGLSLPGLASAASISYTSSAAFTAATTVNFTENYGSGFSNSQDLASGFTLARKLWQALPEDATNIDPVLRSHLRLRDGRRENSG